MECLGSRLAVVPGLVDWDALRDLYLSAKGRGEEEGLAIALSEWATARDFDGLVALLGESSRGHTRIYFLSAIKRVGGHRGARGAQVTYVRPAVRAGGPRPSTVAKEMSSDLLPA